MNKHWITIFKFDIFIAGSGDADTAVVASVVPSVVIAVEPVADKREVRQWHGIKLKTGDENDNTDKNKKEEDDYGDDDNDYDNDDGDNSDETKTIVIEIVIPLFISMLVKIMVMTKKKKVKSECKRKKDREKILKQEIIHQRTFSLHYSQLLCLPSVP